MPRPNSLDLNWFRAHLVQDILPHWLEGAATPAGLFFPRLDRQWRRQPDQVATLVSQSRLLYNFANGYEATGDEPYLQAVRNGARYLIDHFRDPEHGGWFFSVAPPSVLDAHPEAAIVPEVDRARALPGSAAVLDDRKDSYGHAFVVFGLAHAAQCTGDDAYRQAAADTWATIQAKLTDEHGGLKLRTSGDFSTGEPGRSQNPMMHLFEALLALGDLPDMEHVHDDARRVADFVRSRLVRERDHCLPEVYGDDWTELPSEEGGRLDLGHAFEWAFLLSSAAERGLGEADLGHAERFLEYGMQLGYDHASGGIFSPASPDGSSVRQTKGWWEQCEAIRALLHFAALREHDDLWAPLQGTVDFVKRELLDHEHGGWYSGSWTPVSGVTKHDKGSEWKVDYHVVGMCVEAARWA